MKTARNDADAEKRNAARHWMNETERARKAVAASNEITRARFAEWVSYSSRAIRICLEGPEPTDDYGGEGAIGRALARERGAAGELVACVRSLTRATDALAGSVRHLWIEHVQADEADDDIPF